MFIEEMSQEFAKKQQQVFIEKTKEIIKECKQKEQLSAVSFLSELIENQNDLAKLDEIVSEMNEVGWYLETETPEPQYDFSDKMKAVVRQEEMKVKLIYKQTIAEA